MTSTYAHACLVRLWRTQLQCPPVPPMQHKCSAKNCNVVRITGFSCALCGVKLERGCNACSELRSSYVCVDSGFDHMCGPSCRLARLNGQCPISGLKIFAADAPPRPRQPAHGLRSRVRSSDSNFALKIVHALLFSTRRTKFENHRRNGMRVAAERAVHRYVRKKMLMKEPAVFTDMVREYMQRYARCKPLTHLRMTKAQQHSVCQSYTTLITQLITVLDINGMHNAKPDAIATVLLYTLRTGLYVRDEELFPVCSFMIKSLPDAHAINQLVRCAFVFKIICNFAYSRCCSCCARLHLPKQKTL